MIVKSVNPPKIVLEVSVKNLAGEPKTNITTANVRVYTADSGSEVEVLGSTALVQVGVTSTWRYTWEPVSLAASHYVAEYTLIDDTAKTTIGTEDIEIGYLESKIDAIATNVNLIKQVQIGKWEITSGNQLILYQEDNTTEIARFDLFDINGASANDAVAKREKV